MKTHRMLMIMAVVLTAVLSSGRAAAWTGGPLNTEEQECFSVAMVGFDSVINSRMGVPPEHVVDLAATRRLTARTDDVYFSSGIYGAYLLKVMLNAYLWEESPHSYAVKVFYRCAQERSKSRTASNQ